MGELGAANSRGGASPPLDPASFGEECLSAAEEAAQQVLNCIHPTLDSDERRRDVIDYVQRLIKSHLNCEVFPYGSVPLKTYLPDGDIDFTALQGPNTEESLAHDVLAVLLGEQQNKNAEYQVRDTRFIDAEVKLVKCLVQNIVIDISFNQLGGLSTLCFLEQVDRLIGRNHLFKRSIILIKAWCYYESRILGAHHGLISTYALETLILHIFHLFHSSLNGPLAVLYRFLDYYSQFDWENYCISLKGPVCKSSLPDIVVKMPEGGWNNLMFKEVFLENCIEMFSVPSRGLEGSPKAFQTKHLNIIDPLKENNNLGRSVHKGNFYRIQSAFKYGARKLGEVLSQPRDKIPDVIRDFFANTLKRHGCTSSIQSLSVESGDEESLTASFPSPVEWFSEGDFLLKSRVSDFDNDSAGFEEKSTLLLMNELGRCSMGELSVEMTSEAYDRATSNSSLRNGTSDNTPSSNYSSFLYGNHSHKPFHISSRSSAENGCSETGNYLRANLTDAGSQKFGFSSWSEDRDENVDMENTYEWCMDNSQRTCLTGSGSSTPMANFLENLSLGTKEIDLTSVGGESEGFNPLADLTGDYDSHIRSLLHGQLCHAFALSAPLVYNNAQSLSSRIQKKKPWDIVRQSVPFWPSKLSQMNSHAVSIEKSRCPATDSALPVLAFRSEGTQMARGTGTYLPTVNGFYKDRPSGWRSRYKAPSNRNQFYRYGASSNGSYPSSRESNYFDSGTRKVFHARSKSQGRGRMDVSRQSPHSVEDGNQTNGCLSVSGSDRIEFGSVGNLGEEVISESAQFKGSTVASSPERKGTAAMTRAAEPLIHLKNEDEFPPLCQ